MVNKLEDLQKQIESLQKERDDLLSKERAAAIEEVNAKIKTFSIRVRDLNFGEPVKVTATGRAKVAMKYQSGANVWSGRGRRPKWVEGHLAKGGKLEDILIK